MGFNLSDVANWMCKGPAMLAGLFNTKGSIAVGKDADFALFDPEAKRELHASEILYRNKLSPYLGQVVQGRILKTFLRGNCTFENGKIQGTPQGRPLLRRTA